MNNKNKKITFTLIKYIASLFFAVGIIYILFRNQDPVALVEKISEVEYKWIILSMFFGALAYVNRGLRWIVLIDALGYKSTKINSVSAVSIGYFTNMFIPRAGEISRCTALNRVEKIPVDKLFGTILIERVIDLAFLISLFLFTLILKFELIIQFFSELGSQNSDTNSESSFKYYLISSLLLFLVLTYFFLKKWITSTLFYEKILSLSRGLRKDLKVLKR